VAGRSGVFANLGCLPLGTGSGCPSGAGCRVGATGVVRCIASEFVEPARRGWWPGGHAAGLPEVLAVDMWALRRKWLAATGAPCTAGHTVAVGGWFTGTGRIRAGWPAADHRGPPRPGAAAGGGELDVGYRQGPRRVVPARYGVGAGSGVDNPQGRRSGPPPRRSTVTWGAVAGAAAEGLLASDFVTVDIVLLLFGTWDTAVLSWGPSCRWVSGGLRRSSGGAMPVPGIRSVA